MTLATASDSKEVEALARRTFAGYFGHYHADPRLGRDDCDAVYSSWAGASCTDKAVASDVILLRKSGSLAAFATIKQHSDIDFEGVLFGVSPDHQGKGLYPQLMQLTQNWGATRNLRRLLVSTQVTNVTVQKAWCRAGLEPMNSFYTFHLWLVPLPQ
jgi:GNAT superfamily N-acetyltransferase